MNLSGFVMTWRSQLLWRLPIHMYEQLVMESDGDSFVEREREKRGTRVGKDGGEYEAPPNSPKNNLQLWMNTLSQVKF